MDWVFPKFPVATRIRAAAMGVRAFDDWPEKSDFGFGVAEDVVKFEELMLSVDLWSRSCESFFS